MTLEEIRAYAAQLVKDARYENEDLTQEKIAEDLGISQGSVSSALNTASTRWLATQRRIIEKYSKYTIAKRVEYVVELKSEEGGDE